MGINEIFRRTLDAIFPVFCVGCRAEGKIICQNCRSAISRVPLFVCSGCGRFSAAGITHPACLGRTPLASLLAPYPYANPLVRRLIKNFKYRGAGESEKILCNLAASAATAFRLFIPSDATVTAMPLYLRRERERGFNQSEIIARAFAEALKLKYNFNLVRRVRSTEEQAKLPYHERGENCLGAFSATGATGAVILVDDVVTTGATMKAAADALRATGAERVIGFALAHG